MAVTRDDAGEPDTSGWDPQTLVDTPLGHELANLCRRLLGPGPGAPAALREAFAEPFSDRSTGVDRVLRACRRRVGTVGPPTAVRTAEPVPGVSLREATAAELARATATLTPRQRELLALSGLLRLSHGQIATLLALDPDAVASGLGRARLALRAALRGAAPRGVGPSGTAPGGADPSRGPACADADRVLRLLARRLDAEVVSDADTDWLFAHMGECPGCDRAHGAMLEAAVRYRMWGRS